MSDKVQLVVRLASKTAVQGFLGALTAANLAGQEITVTLIGAAIVAGIAAALSAIWNGLVAKP